MSNNLETDEEDEDNADDKRKKNKKEEYVKDGLDVDTFVKWKLAYKNEAFVKLLKNSYFSSTSTVQ